MTSETTVTSPSVLVTPVPPLNEDNSENKYFYKSQSNPSPTDLNLLPFLSRFTDKLYIMVSTALISYLSPDCCAENLRCDSCWMAATDYSDEADQTHSEEDPDELSEADWTRWLAWSWSRDSRCWRPRCESSETLRAESCFWFSPRKMFLDNDNIKINRFRDF